jgi:hypothetical protein
MLNIDHDPELINGLEVDFPTLVVRDFQHIRVSIQKT